MIKPDMQGNKSQKKQQTRQCRALIKTKQIH